MISEFIDRENELKLLEEQWANLPSFVVLYGRRRTGKTRLLVEFSKRKRAFFHTFMEDTRERQIRKLREELASFFNDELFLSLDDWYSLFKYLSLKIEEKTLIILDEFSYALKSDRTILSALQRAWDHDLSRKPVMLVLSGSLIGMMVDEVLSYSSPLYGRRTASFRLRPLTVFDSLKFFSNFRTGLELYMLIGGIPSYLIVASRYRDTGTFVEETFLKPEGFFYDEPYILLSGELRELKTYFSILSAMAHGKTRPSEIASYAGLEGRKVYPYLENLIRLGFVERELPVAKKEKRGIYRLKDPMLLTWFSIVPKNRTGIELGLVTYDDVKEDLQRILGVRFEDVAREFLIELNKAEKLPFKFTRIGCWWHRGEEIDLVAVEGNMKKVLLVEVKWKDMRKREARGVLKDLKRKFKLMGLEGWEAYFGLMARKVEGKGGLKEEGFNVWDLDDLEVPRG
ncbi:ATP-binding protein [Thermococcus camini]|uniref:ATPase n=1 Tax=Thermococcus camini TaxID=2016373 RepID=A0A7G2D9U6_9EURY|nr:ATP-binding protein [Thermococcus camini]CAD5244429.1 ATPase [Thermococcus camini]